MSARRFRGIQFRAVVLAALFAVAACARPAQIVDIQVESARPQEKAGLRVTYAGLLGAPSFDLGRADGRRTQEWRVETPGVTLVSVDGRDRLTPVREGATLPAAIVVRLAPQPFDSLRAGAAVVQFGDSLLLATGKLGAIDGKSVRLSVRLQAPTAAAAFGAAGSEGAAWASPDGGGLLMIGALATQSAPTASEEFAGAAPGWARKEASALTARLPGILAGMTGGRAAASVDLLLAVDDTGPGLAYQAHVDGRQIAILLMGAAWRDSGPDGAELLDRAIASEMAAAAFTDIAPAGAPPWIARGLADALADEAMVKAGLWAPDEAKRALARAAVRCKSALAGETLSTALEHTGDSRACGHVLARSAAGTLEAARFVRDFAARAHKHAADSHAFLDTAAAHAGPHAAALMRTLMTEQGAAAASSLDALRVVETDPALGAR